MIILNKDLMNSVEIIKELINQNLPIKLSYKIMTLVEKINEPINNFEITKKNIIEEHIKRDEEGNPVYGIIEETGEPDKNKLIVENTEELQNSLNSLYMTEVNIDFNKISIDEFEILSLSPAKLSLLRWLIDFGD